MHPALLPTDKCWLHTHTDTHTLIHQFFQHHDFPLRGLRRRWRRRTSKFRHVLSVMKTSIPNKCSTGRAKDKGIWRSLTQPHFRFLMFLVLITTCNIQTTGQKEHKLLLYSHCSLPNAFFLTSYKIPPVLCNPKVRYVVHNTPSPVSILNQYTPTLFKKRFNIICNQWPGLQIGLFPSC